VIEVVLSMEARGRTIGAGTCNVALASPDLRSEFVITPTDNFDAGARAAIHKI
jgi:hypothetical protein